MTRALFRPSRMLLVVVLFVLLGAIPLALSVLWLRWLLLLPLAAGWWVVRARVLAELGGLTVDNGLGARHYGWRQVDGFDIERLGGVRLVLTDGRRPRLTAVQRRDLRGLLAVADAAGRRETPGGPG